MSKANSFSCPGAEILINNPNFVFENDENYSIVNKMGTCVGRYYLKVFAIENCDSIQNGNCMPFTREEMEKKGIKILQCPLPIGLGFDLE